jgi:hypothetical protein
MRVSVASVGAVLVAAGLCGCATNNNACVLGSELEIGAPSANPTGDHAAAAPGNQVKFSSAVIPTIISGRGCALPQDIKAVYATWTTSNPKNITISSAQVPGATGLATSVGKTILNLT